MRHFQAAADFADAFLLFFRRALKDGNGEHGGVPAGFFDFGVAPERLEHFLAAEIPVRAVEIDEDAVFRVAFFCGFESFGGEGGEQGRSREAEKKKDCQKLFHVR